MTYVIAIIKVGSVTYIIQKAIKVAGEKNFAEAISLAGISLCGVQFVSWVKFCVLPQVDKVVSFGKSVNGFLENATSIRDSIYGFFGWGD